ncbi:putative amidohydrolase family protein [Echria macrotheca]|uniref:Amidohydrolase family protein n=1 Tax=Echria macrotheca TaxID=438768 RepID=A0AAJ0BT51_9PEZI|nr:putative amidohydrolase family protein [Echria macrotheca]
MLQASKRGPFLSYRLLIVLSLASSLARAAAATTSHNIDVESDGNNKTNGTATVPGLFGQDVDDSTLADSYHQGSLRGSLLLINGRILTMDDHGTVVSVLAIHDGEIVYVGNSRGRLTVPGLIDCHNHIVLLGNRPGYHTPLEYAASIPDVMATYRRRAASVPKDGSFITTIGGFDPIQFREGRLPTLAELDAAVPDHPVFLSVGFAGPAATNTLGRAFFTSVVPNTNIATANGSITQGDRNGAALLALRQRFLSPIQRQHSAEAAMAYAASVGSTTHLDQGAFPATGTTADGSGNEDLYTFHEPFLATYKAGMGKVRLRVNFLSMDSNDSSSSALAERLRNTFPFFGNSMMRTGSVGEFIVLEYDGGPVFEAAARRVAAAGWRLEVHSLTAQDYQNQITAFEAINASGSPITALRWVIAHVPLITRDWLRRLRALGGGVNLSGWRYLSPASQFVGGPPAGPPWRDVLHSGIHAGGGGDGANIAPLSPWPHIYYATTGRNARGDLINPNQTITRMEALELYTRRNTWFLGGPDEDLLGILQVGRLGDVAVLSHDLFAVPDEQVKNITSVLTVVGGVVVHEAL